MVMFSVEKAGSGITMDIVQEFLRNEKLHYSPSGSWKNIKDAITGTPPAHFASLFNERGGDITALQHEIRAAIMKWNESATPTNGLVISPRFKLGMLRIDKDNSGPGAYSVRLIADVKQLFSLSNVETIVEDKLGVKDLGKNDSQNMFARTFAKLFGAVPPVGNYNTSEQIKFHEDYGRELMKVAADFSKKGRYPETKALMNTTMDAKLRKFYINVYFHKDFPNVDPPENIFYRDYEKRMLQKNSGVSFDELVEIVDAFLMDLRIYQRNYYYIVQNMAGDRSRHFAFDSWDEVETHYKKLEARYPLNGMMRALREYVENGRRNGTLQDSDTNSCYAHMRRMSHLMPVGFESDYLKGDENDGRPPHGIRVGDIEVYEFDSRKVHRAKDSETREKDMAKEQSYELFKGILDAAQAPAQVEKARAKIEQFSSDKTGNLTRSANEKLSGRELQSRRKRREKMASDAGLLRRKQVELEHSVTKVQGIIKLQSTFKDKNFEEALKNVEDKKQELQALQTKIFEQNEANLAQLKKQRDGDEITKEEADKIEQELKESKKKQKKVLEQIEQEKKRLQETFKADVVEKFKAKYIEDYDIETAQSEAAKYFWQRWVDSSEEEKKALREKELGRIAERAAKEAELYAKALLDRMAILDIDNKEYETGAKEIGGAVLNIPTLDYVNAVTGEFVKKMELVDKQWNIDHWAKDLNTGMRSEDTIVVDGFRVDSKVFDEVTKKGKDVRSNFETRTVAKFNEAMEDFLNAKTDQDIKRYFTEMLSYTPRRIIDPKLLFGGNNYKVAGYGHETKATELLFDSGKAWVPLDYHGVPGKLLGHMLVDNGQSWENKNNAWLLDKEALEVPGILYGDNSKFGRGIMDNLADMSTYLEEPLYGSPYRRKLMYLLLSQRYIAGVIRQILYRAFSNQNTVRRYSSKWYVWESGIFSGVYKYAENDEKNLFLKRKTELLYGLLKKLLEVNKKNNSREFSVNPDGALLRTLEAKIGESNNIPGEIVALTQNYALSGDVEEGVASSGEFFETVVKPFNGIYENSEYKLLLRLINKRGESDPEEKQRHFSLFNFTGHEPFKIPMYMLAFGASGMSDFENRFAKLMEKAADEMAFYDGNTQVPGKYYARKSGYRDFKFYDEHWFTEKTNNIVYNKIEEAAKMFTVRLLKEEQTITKKSESELRGYYGTDVERFTKLVYIIQQSAMIMPLRFRDFKDSAGFKALSGQLKAYDKTRGADRVSSRKGGGDEVNDAQITLDQIKFMWAFFMFLRDWAFERMGSELSKARDAILNKLFKNDTAYIEVMKSIDSVSKEKLAEIEDRLLYNNPIRTEVNRVYDAVSDFRNTVVEEFKKGDNYAMGGNQFGFVGVSVGGFVF